MQLGSWQYFIFFPLVAVFYFALPQRFRWLLLLGTSILCYLSAPTGFLFPICAVTITGFLGGNLIGRSQDLRLRKLWLVVGLLAILASLLYFKYHDFWMQAFATGEIPDTLPAPDFQLTALLPIGISFYTFQAMSYLIDVFRRDQPPERNIGIFALYLLFFVKLIAGPIERGRNLLAQLHRTPLPLDTERVASGLRLVAWGLFKKFVVANRLAPYVDSIYASPMDFQGWPVILAIYFYAFQIYADFSGYTDIAIGSARILGFDLTQNFSRPYLAHSVIDFWRRWHISLTSWFRDYVYVPLGGNRVAEWRWYFNVMVVFLLSALWHGTTWTFVAWGTLHGFYYIGTVWLRQVARQRKFSGFLASFPRWTELLGILVTFQLVAFAWIFFRADSFAHAYSIIQSACVFGQPLDQELVSIVGSDLLACGIFLVVLISAEMIQEKGWLGWVMRSKLRWVGYYLMLMVLLLYSVPAKTGFVYGRF
jgi:alginate O-acetyltransferase complex protein AlgI